MDNQSEGQSQKNAAVDYHFSQYRMLDMQSGPTATVMSGDEGNNQDISDLLPPNLGQNQTFNTNIGVGNV